MKSVSVAISTRGRTDVLKHSVSEWKRHYPNINIIIVEDNGPTPRGIASTKNICLDLLIKSGSQHCFLSDDDIYPTTNRGVYRYIRSPYNHLCFSFDRDYKGKRISHDVYIKKVIRGHNIFNSPCGCLLYVNRKVLTSGVRYDENFGIWGGEHKDYSIQIHKKGLTPYPFIDVKGSDKHFYSHDKNGTAEGSVPEHIRVREIRRNSVYYNKKWNL